MSSQKKINPDHGGDQDFEGHDFNYRDFEDRIIVAHERMIYKDYIRNHPEIHAILAAHPDRREAENVIYLKIEEETGDSPLAYSLSTQIGKRHPTYKRERDAYALIRREELRLSRERRDINRKTGGKVIFLIDRLGKAQRQRIDSINKSHSQSPAERMLTLKSSGSIFLKAVRSYWHDYAKLARLIKSDWKAPETAPNTDHRPLGDFVLSFDELVNLDLPERENIVAPWLAAQSICLVFAPRGLGKTWFCMELALAVADGRKFLSWPAPTARRVLYIDGEMPTKMLVDRFKTLSRTKPSNLDILPSEVLWTEDVPLNLNIESDQKRIIGMLEAMTEDGRKPELIIFDNLSSLTAGGDENSNSELDSLLRFMVGLRHKGFAILLVHHAGKSGDQRGASRREDLLDTSIKLGVVKDGIDQKGAKFEVEFVKVRGERPNPDKIQVELVGGEHGGFEWVIGQKDILTPQMKMLIAIRDTAPKTQVDLTEVLGMSQGEISKQMRKGRDVGHINGDRRPGLTAAGLAWCNKISPAYIRSDADF